MKQQKIPNEDERLMQRANEVLQLTEESYLIKKAAELLQISQGSLYKHLNDPESSYEDIRDYRGRRYVAANDIKAIWVIRHSLYRRTKVRAKEETKEHDSSGLAINYSKSLDWAS